MSFIGKKEDVFFKLFADSIAKVAEASAVFMDLVTNFENAEQKVAHLKVLETECDDQTFNIIKQLNRSFVTPLDREDIFHIAKEIDGNAGIHPAVNVLGQQVSVYVTLVDNLRLV